MKLNLQRHTFHEAFLKMLSLPGWELLEEDNFLALKAPTRLSFINLVWAQASLANIEKAKKFYSSLSFSWILPETEDNSILCFSKFNPPELSAEMLLDLNSYQPQGTNQKIEVIQVKTEQHFKQWSETAGAIFGFPARDMAEFFLHFIETAGDIPFLGFYEGKPVATSLIYIGKQIAGLYTIGVKEEYRRLGFGRAMTEACLNKAQQQGTNQAVLYASNLGKLLYEQMGFELTQNIYEYFLESY